MLVNWLLEKLHARANALIATKTLKNARLGQDEDLKLAQTRRDLAIEFIDRECYAEAEAEYQFLIDNDLSKNSDMIALGFALKAQNKLEAAQMILERVVSKESSQADVHYMLASIYVLKNLDDLAAVNFESALKHNSQLRPAYGEYCALLCNQKKFDRANEVVTIGLVHFPLDIEFLFQKGNICVVEKKYDVASECFKRVIQLEPDNVGAYWELCMVFQAQAKHEPALRCLDAIIERLPNDARVLHERGRVLNSLNRVEEALVSLNRALDLDPNNVDTLIDQGCVLGHLGCLENANKVLLRALEICPNSVVGNLNAGVVAFKHGRHSESVNYLKTAERIIFSQISDDEKTTLETLPVTEISWGVQINHFAMIQYSLSLLYLAEGNFNKGWRAYEWRWCVPHFQKHKRSFLSRLWLGGEDIAGKSILLYGEQGFGDTLQFVRFVPMVKSLGANVLLEVPPALKPLLGEVSGIDQVLCFGETLPITDFHCPLMSLPLCFGTSLETIPNGVNLFDLNIISPASIFNWQQKLTENGLKRIGIVWSGNKDHAGDLFRSIPLKNFSTVFLKEFNFFSLQKEVRLSDQDALAANPHVIDLSADFFDFLDTAALIYHLDLVIAVDTSVAHLAASMGKPVWVLLPYASDWRWLLEGKNSPWYPTVTLFRQTKHGVWDDVLETVAQCLKAF